MSGIAAVANAMQDNFLFPALLAGTLVLAVAVFFGYRGLYRREPTLILALPAAAPPRGTWTRGDNPQQDIPEPVKTVAKPKESLVHIRTGPAITGPHVTPRRLDAITELHSQPVTRVEWDRIVASGRDPQEWFLRYPRWQTVMPEGVLHSDDTDNTSIKFKIDHNISVWQWHSR